LQAGSFYEVTTKELPWQYDKASYERQERDCLSGMTAGKDRAMLNVGEYGCGQLELYDFVFVLPSRK
jgi:hypothetical protein